MSLHYWQSGTGPPLVGIAGFGCAHWLLKPLAQQLEGQFCVVLPDNRGMGFSPKTDAPFDIEDLASDILTLIRRHIGQPVYLLGVSMGGFIVQQLLTMAPEDIKAAAIFCSTSGGPQFRPLFTFWSQRQMQKVLEMDPDAYAHWILEPVVSPRLASYPEAYDFLLKHRLLYREDLRQVLEQYHAMARFFVNPLDLAAVEIPVLVACGAADPVFPVANSRLLAELLPRGELKIFSDTDHLFFVEKPREVGQAVLEFFSGK
ncbi:MAG: AB hydrolase-1 protein [Magnetococcales bacterium]|nr:AB hydrolase-1 protein [Magnetococcales bacterium]HIJ84355.1 alpha/beta hydrolase [Magnetococcales bacterium]